MKFISLFFRQLFFFIAVGCFFGGITSFVWAVFAIFDGGNDWEWCLGVMCACFGFSFFIGFYLWKNNFFNRNK